MQHSYDDKTRTITRKITDLSPYLTPGRYRLITSYMMTHKSDAGQRNV